MGETILVDFHCHSTCSDGTLTPRAVALRLVAAGVRAAALTDHDTMDGQAEFGAALADRGVACLTGLELTVSYQDQETHLLALGADPLHAELQAALLMTRQPGVRRAPRLAATLAGGRAARAPGAWTALGLEMASAIDLIHAAGGKAFLAHPHMLGTGLAQFRAVLAALRAEGLDGVEAYYRRYTPVQQQMLADLADEQGLLVSGGSDTHECLAGEEQTYGVAVPAAVWERLRAAVCGERP